MYKHIYMYIYNIVKHCSKATEKYCDSQNVQMLFHIQELQKYSYVMTYYVNGILSSIT